MATEIAIRRACVRVRVPWSGWREAGSEQVKLFVMRVCVAAEASVTEPRAFGGRTSSSSHARTHAHPINKAKQERFLQSRSSGGGVSVVWSLLE